MAGKTPKEAVDNFLRPIQLVLSCFTKSVIYHAGSYQLDGGPYAATVTKDGRFSLPGGSLWLSVSMQYKIVEADGERGPYKVKTTAYRYAIEDKNCQEVLSYDWHPGGINISFPHVHVHAQSSVLSITDFKKKHLPTGRVAIEQVLYLTVKEFGVRPIKKNWEKILSDAQGQFETWRTWHY